MLLLLLLLLYNFIILAIFIASSFPKTSIEMKDKIKYENGKINKYSESSQSQVIKN